jgi:hypothetical protein
VSCQRQGLTPRRLRFTRPMAGDSPNVPSRTRGRHADAIPAGDRRSPTATAGSTGRRAEKCRSV